MDFFLNQVDARVLGCLIEKQLTTPEYYPLTLKSLTAACNQKSNRDPLMSVQETEVVRALDRLRDMHLAGERHVAGTRVAKYEHKVVERFRLEPAELAILCVLLLRGPQTIGEIRSHCGRMYPFGDLVEVEESLQGLQEHDGGALIVKLPRLPGHKENRIAHLLSGEPDVEDLQKTLAPEPATLQVRAENERIAALEEEVRQLKAAFETFKKQFE